MDRRRAETLRFCYVSRRSSACWATPSRADRRPRWAPSTPAIADVKLLIRKGSTPSVAVAGTPVFRTDGCTCRASMVTGVGGVPQHLLLQPASGVVELRGGPRHLERRASQARIAHMAQHDMLTSCPTVRW